MVLMLKGKDVKYASCRIAVNDQEEIMFEQGFTAMDITFNENEKELEIELSDMLGRKDSMCIFLNKESGQALVDWVAEKIK